MPEEWIHKGTLWVGSRGNSEAIGRTEITEIPGEVGKKQGSAAIRLMKIHIVEKIEKLAPELQVCALCQASILDHRKIEVDVLGTP